MILGRHLRIISVIFYVIIIDILIGFYSGLWDISMTFVDKMRENWENLGQWLKTNFQPPNCTKFQPPQSLQNNILPTTKPFNKNPINNFNTQSSKAHFTNDFKYFTDSTIIPQQQEKVTMSSICFEIFLAFYIIAKSRLLISHTIPHIRTFFLCHNSKQIFAISKHFYGFWLCLVYAIMHGTVNILENIFHYVSSNPIW